MRFDFSIDTFDFQNLLHLICQMTLLISKIRRVLISQMTLLISKIRCVLISQLTLSISKISHLWFFKWHFWFPKFIAFDFSNNTFDFANDTFDFQTLSRLISQMTRLISKICRIWFPKFDAFWFLKWHFRFPKLVAFDFSNDTFDFQNLSRLISQITLLISSICRIWFRKWHFWFPNFVTFDFQNLSHLISQMTLLISKISLVSQLGVAHLFDELTRDLWLFCSLLVFGCHVRPRNSWKWYVLLWNLVTIMYVYCSMF